MSSVFGGSKQSSSGSNESTSTSQSQSNNQAYPMLSQALGGQVNNGAAANNSLSAMLGIGGDPTAQNQAFKNWQNSTGYQFGLNQGDQAVTQNAATKGLLDSGATAKALNTYGQNYANTQYQNYTNLLQGQQNAGTTAGQVISGAGQQSSSSSNSQSKGTTSGSGSSKPGIGGFVGGLLSGGG